MPSIYTATDAAAYERQMGRWSAKLAGAFIAFAGIDPGDRILDLGCGTGSLAFALAARPEPIQIVGLDISPVYIAAALEQAHDPRLQFRVGDAVAIDAPDRGFDRCYSLFALNFVLEPLQALAEMRRVTRPGGTVAAAVWGGVAAQRLFWQTAAALDPEADKMRARQFASPLTGPGELAAAFAAAGLRDRAATALTLHMVYADFADYWEPITAAQGPIGDYVKQLPAPALAALRGAVERAFLGGRPQGPRSLLALAWTVKGRA